MAFLKPLFAVLLLATCGASFAQSQRTIGCVTSFNNTNNYFPAPFQIDVYAVPLGSNPVQAQDFTVQYNNTFKMVSNSFVNETYVGYQCGTPMPNSVPAGAKVFQIPLAALGTDTTVPVAFIELLGLQSALKYMDPTFITSPCLLKLVNESAIASFDTSFPANKTLIAQQESTLSAVFKSSQKPSNNSRYISFDATSDPGPLKRAEWIKYLALFFNLEPEAKAIYDQIALSYNCQRAAYANRTSKPVVAWVNYYQNVWTVSNATYKLLLTADAGGANLPNASYRAYNLSKGAAEVTAFQAALQNVTVVIDESYAADPATYTLATFLANARLNGTATPPPFVTNRQVWRQDKLVSPDSTGGLAWFEEAVAEPQVVLQDLISAFWGTNVTHTFFRNVAQNETLIVADPTQCTRNATSAKPVTVVACPLVTANGTAALPASP
jgi:hypothetical protein